jgi:hypothetical protein
MGGAHNVALAHLSGSPPSDRLNGQARAYESLKKSSGKTKGNSVLNQLGNAYKSEPRVGSSKESGQFMLFMVMAVITVVYVMVFKSYHAALEKQDSLTELFKNPNARVASGKQGKKLTKKLKALEEPEKKKASKVKKSELDETLEKV